MYYFFLIFANKWMVVVVYCLSFINFSHLSFCLLATEILRLMLGACKKTPELNSRYNLELAIAQFRVVLRLSIQASYENEFNLHVNKISFSYERMAKPRFEKEAKVIRKCSIDFTCNTLFCDETRENVY